jgi:hypothetical protein
MRETNRVVPTHTQPRRSRLKTLWILCCAVVSIPLALVLEGVTGFASPGARMMSHLLPPHGLRDFGRRVVVSITLDSALCFAFLVGVYMLFSKLFMAKRTS